MIPRGIAFRFDRHDDLSASCQCRKIGRRFDTISIKTRYGSNLEIVGALSDEQTNRTIALHLHRQLAFELQRRGKQHGGRDGLTQQLAHRLRIVGMLAQL